MFTFFSQKSRSWVTTRTVFEERMCASLSLRSVVCGIGLLLPVPLLAQISPTFDSFVATDAGDLYFYERAGLTLAGKLSLNDGIVRYTEARSFEWFAPAWARLPGTVPGASILDVSADGRVFALTSVITFFVCDHCPIGSASVGAVMTPDLGVQAFRGSVQLSRNGRYVAVQTGTLSGTLIDLTTGISRPFNGAPLSRREAVADDGTLVLRGNTDHEIIIQHASSERRFQIAQTVLAALIDGKAGRLVYISIGDNRRLSLRTIDIASGLDRSISDQLVFDSIDGYLPVISTDGETILYLGLSAAGSVQAFTADLGGTATRQLTSAESLTGISMSPDGSIGYAATVWNRMIEIDLSSGRSKEILPRTPRWIYDALVPGSMVMLTGSGLSDNTELAASDPLPVSLAGVSISLLDDFGRRISAPLISVGPERILFQLPFEARLGSADLNVSSISPFQQYGGGVVPETRF